MIQQLSYNIYVTLFNIAKWYSDINGGLFLQRKDGYMNTSKLIIVVILVLALSMPAMPVSAQSPATSVSFSSPTPNPGVVGGDISFTLVVNVANIDPGVAGIDFYFTYDPLYVTPVPTVDPLPDFFGPSVVTSYQTFPPSVGGCPATAPAAIFGMPCIHLAAAGPAQITRSGAVARFHFVGFALTPPPPAASACFGLVAAITMVDSNGFPVVAPPATPAVQCVPIVPSMVTGIVLRQGTPGLPPGPGTLACSEVRIISGGVVIFGPEFTGFAGGFSIPLLFPPGNLGGGSHTLRAEYPGYLASQKTITIGTGGGLLDAGTTTLRGGDINGDNRINILDVGIVIGKFGGPPVPVRSSFFCPALPPDEPADINDDGFVNISDLAIIAGSNFGLVGPTPWQ